VSLNVNQRLFRKFSLNGGVTYTMSEYGTAVNAATAGAASRSDDQLGFTLRLSHPFYKRGTWSIFYQYSDNRSNVPNLSFQSNQTGFEISYAF
ncbi:MAG TPA: hypothetical protein VF988_08905, partial [Verrucomicrobiae bacterium]